MRIDIEVNDVTNPDVDWIVAQGIIRDVIAELIIGESIEIKLTRKE